MFTFYFQTVSWEGTTEKQFSLIRTIYLHINRSENMIFYKK